MKNASVATQTILNSAGEIKILRADFYTITLKNGTVFRFTDSDHTMTIGANVFSHGLIIERSKTKQSIGVNIDTVQVTIIYNGGTLIQGRPIIHQFKNGLFRGARCKIQKGFFLDWADLSPGLVDWFEGNIGSPACDHISASFEVRSVLEILNTQMPQDVAQTTCSNVLYDAVCGASEAAFTYSCTATSIVDRRKFTLTGTSQTAGYFALGKIKITGGANAGQARTVKSYVGGVVELFNPLPYDLVSGDTLTAAAGCDMTRPTCNAKFNRLATGFQATPYVPVPETAIEGGGVTASVAPSGSTGGGPGLVGSVISATRRKGTYNG